MKESESEQHEDNERTRLEEGWARGRTYQDTGSASRYARKTRDDFGKLLTDLRTGVFRRDNEVRLHVTSHRRLYDLNNPRDRRTLNEDGVDSAYESAKTSMRIRRHLPETPVPWWGTAPSATNSPDDPCLEPVAWKSALEGLKRRGIEVHPARQTRPRLRRFLSGHAS